MDDTKLVTPKKVFYNRSDVIVVAVVGIVALSLLAYVIQSVAGLPGVVIPLGALWIAAGVFFNWAAARMEDFPRLSKMFSEYKKWLISAVVFGLLMPAVFPNGAYETSPWLMWLNATILVWGLLGLWAIRFFAFCLHRLVNSRTNSHKRG